MLKKILITSAFLIGIFITVSIAQTAKNKANYTHDFPAEMAPAVKTEYIKLFEKGKILYGINCASCHNVTIKGVEEMPDFTKEHLAQYELRIQNPKHEEALSEMRINAEELQQIMVFLTYYKKHSSATAKK